MYVTNVHVAFVPRHSVQMLMKYDEAHLTRTRTKIRYTIRNNLFKKD